MRAHRMLYAAAVVLVASIRAAQSEESRPVEEYVLGVSYLAALSSSVDAEGDIRRLARLGYNHLWIWATYDVPSAQEASMVDKNGKIRKGPAARLDAIIGLAGANGMTINLTLDPEMHVPMWRGKTPPFETYENAVRNVAKWLRANANYKRYQNVTVNVCNECVINWRRGVTGEGVTKLMKHYGGRDLAEHPAVAIQELFDAANEGPGNPIRVFVSLGFPDEAVPKAQAAALYRALMPYGGRLLAAPHFDRTCADWYKKTGERIREFRNLLGVDADIYLQEENRRHYKKIQCDIQVEHYKTAACQAKQEGAWGWNFQSQAGFGESDSFFGGLDSIEKEAVETLPAGLTECP
ncbi:MAG: hypothetical protein HYX75_06075 [Acidobacteria bacterium]|nr:hypothetical protein [Acidobacteriota bacterium]